MRFEIHNRFSDDFGYSMVRTIQSCGVKWLWPYNFPKKFESLIRSMQYDPKRHVFYFEKDREFRRQYYDHSVTCLRGFIVQFIRFLPQEFMKYCGTASHIEGLV